MPNGQMNIPFGQYGVRGPMAFQQQMGELGQVLGQQAQQQQEQSQMFQKILMEAAIKQQLQQQQQTQQTELFRQLIGQTGGGGGRVVPTLGAGGGISLAFRPFGQTEQYSQAVQQAVGGQLPWETIRTQFPTEIKKTTELQKRFTPIEKAPEFRRGRGIPALISPTKAKIGGKEQGIIDQIKTQADFDELIDRADEAKKKGIDINAIFEYFGRPELKF